MRGLCRIHVYTLAAFKTLQLLKISKLSKFAGLSKFSKCLKPAELLEFSRLPISSGRPNSWRSEIFLHIQNSKSFRSFQNCQSSEGYRTCRKASSAVMHGPNWMFRPTGGCFFNRRKRARGSVSLHLAWYTACIQAVDMAAIRWKPPQRMQQKLSNCATAKRHAKVSGNCECTCGRSDLRIAETLYMFWFSMINHVVIYSSLPSVWSMSASSWLGIGASHVWMLISVYWTIADEASWYVIAWGLFQARWMKKTCFQKHI